jgi:hypothetical protein
VTAGDDLKNVARFLPAGASNYTAADVIAHLLDRKLANETLAAEY